jgi:hypothetical protein
MKQIGFNHTREGIGRGRQPGNVQGGRGQDTHCAENERWLKPCPSSTGSLPLLGHLVEDPQNQWECRACKENQHGGKQRICRKITKLWSGTPNRKTSVQAAAMGEPARRLHHHIRTIVEGVFLSHGQASRQYVAKGDRKQKSEVQQDSLPGGRAESVRDLCHKEF